MSLGNKINHYLLTCGLIVFVATATADSERVIDYRYDAVGNIIGIQSGLNLGAPEITKLNPPFVNQDGSKIITATGVNLLRATVSSDNSDLSVSNIINLSATTVQFHLAASANAVIGETPLTFTNRIGSNTADIVIAERTPVVATDPNPIVLMPDNQPVTVTLSFEQPFAEDQTYNIAITDPSIATVSASTLTLTAGDTEASVQMTGLLEGVTGFQIDQLAKFIALAIPVTVSSEYLPLPAGSHKFATRRVGVTVFPSSSFQRGDTKVAIPRPVGVTVFPSSSFQRGDTKVAIPRPVGITVFPSSSFQRGDTKFAIPRPVGVTAFPSSSFQQGDTRFATQRPVGVTIFPSSSFQQGDTRFATQRPVGVTIFPSSSFQQGDTKFATQRPVGVTIFPSSSFQQGDTKFATQRSVGVARGAVVLRAEPMTVRRDASHTLVLHGAELDNVTTLSWLPADGISQIGSYTVNAAADQLTLQLAVSATAATGQRSLRLTTTDGQQIFTQDILTIE